MGQTGEQLVGAPHWNGDAAVEICLRLDVNNGTLYFSVVAKLLLSSVCEHSSGYGINWIFSWCRREINKNITMCGIFIAEIRWYLSGKREFRSLKSICFVLSTARVVASLVETGEGSHRQMISRGWMVVVVDTSAQTSSVLWPSDNNHILFVMELLNKGFNEHCINWWDGGCWVPKMQRT